MNRHPPIPFSLGCIFQEEEEEEEKKCFITWWVQKI